jgi:hypothetical protein
MRVPAKHAGKTIRCKECRVEIHVDAVAEEVSADDQPRRRKRAELPMGWIIGIGVPVLVVFGVFTYLMSRGGGGIAADNWKSAATPKPPANPVNSATPANSSSVPIATFGAMFKPLGDAPDGPHAISLSTPRKADVVSTPPAYEFAYQFQGATPRAGEVYYLVARTADKMCDLPIDGGAMKSSETLVARFSAEPRGTVEFWVERQKNSRSRRERTSNVVTVSWPPNN